MSFEVGPYEPADREDYLRLLRDAWGEGADAGDEFDWWFDGNPAGSLMLGRRDGRPRRRRGRALALPMVARRRAVDRRVLACTR